MKILVTGFDPFGGEKVYSAIDSVNRLPKEIDGASIITLKLPTVFNESVQVLREKMEEIQPDVVLAIGQAGGRFGLTPERVAINQDDAVIPDNKGNQPIDQTIQPDGAPAYFSQLPIKAMVEAIKAEGLPASVSNTAGTYVCNHVMYQLLYLTHTTFPQTKAGFMHIPFTMQQVVNRSNRPAMNIDDIVKGIVAALEAIVAYQDQSDLKVIGGATH
ncbi:pyroglutamyl-peptidase I [Atopobacter phocae]|uniref:pyroglutamyl-peptidase I n=1 Tax=Atopobacter phocae TaxID=136492 RepID=UPI000470D57B|nr:pyroglutamyl-peptidase I [Atopobacter phocae]